MSIAYRYAWSAYTLGHRLREVTEDEARTAYGMGQSTVVLREVDGRVDAVAEVNPQTQFIQLRVPDSTDPRQQLLHYVIGRPPGHELRGVFVERIHYRPDPGGLAWIIRLSPAGTAHASGGGHMAGKSFAANVDTATLDWPQFGAWEQLFALPRDVDAFLRL